MRFFCLALMVGAFAACSSNGSKTSGPIPKEKMKLVLFDVLRAQEYATLKYGNDTIAVNTNLPIMLQQVFDIHKISKDDFYNSFRYYEDHPDENQVLIDSLDSYTKKKREGEFMQLR